MHVINSWQTVPVNTIRPGHRLRRRIRRDRSGVRALPLLTSICGRFSAISSPQAASQPETIKLDRSSAHSFDDAGETCTEEGFYGLAPDGGVTAAMEGLDQVA